VAELKTTNVHDTRSSLCSFLRHSFMRNVGAVDQRLTALLMYDSRLSLH